MWNCTPAVVPQAKCTSVQAVTVVCQNVLMLNELAAIKLVSEFLRILKCSQVIHPFFLSLVLRPRRDATFGDVMRWKHEGEIFFYCFYGVKVFFVNFQSSFS